MNRVVWVLQIVLGVFFVVMGVNHLVMPDSLPEPLEWMYDLPDWVHWFSGTAELLGGLGLVLPSVTRIKPWLTPLAAGGLAVVMAGAATWHGSRGEVRSVVVNLLVACLLAFIAVVRWRVQPIDVGRTGRRDRYRTVKGASDSQAP